MKTSKSRKTMLKKEMNWINTNDRMPDSNSKVMVYFVSEYKKKIITIATYIGHKTELAEDFVDCFHVDEFCEYDEEKDCYWTPEGFYEYQYEGDIMFFLHEKIEYWMGLPDYPKDNKNN